MRKTKPLTDLLVDAIFHEDVVEVKRLLDRGADANAVTGRKGRSGGNDEDQRKPLLVLAAEIGNANVAAALLNAAADIEAEWEEQKFFYHDNGSWASVGDALAVASRGGHTEVVELLLKRGARRRPTALVLAVKARQLEVARLLLDDGTDPGRSTCAPLRTAVLTGELDLVKLIVEYDADLNHQDGEETSPLGAALAWGHVEIARFLIGKGARPPAQTFIDGLVPQARARACAVSAALGLGLRETWWRRAKPAAR